MLTHAQTLTCPSTRPSDHAERRKCSSCSSYTPDSRTIFFSARLSFSTLRHFHIPIHTLAGFLILTALLFALATPASAAPPSLSASASFQAPNTIRISWTVTGGDSTNLLYVYSEHPSRIPDPGFAPQRCNGTSGCSIDVRISQTGTYSFVVAVKNDNGDFATRRATVDVTDPPPLAIPRSQRYVTVGLYSAPRDIPVTWSTPTQSDAVVVISKRGEGPLATVAASGGSYTIPASTYSAGGTPVPGRHTYELRHCIGATSNRICSYPVLVHVFVTADRFAGPERLFLDPSGQPLALSWTSLGSFWYVDDRLVDATGKPQSLAGRWFTSPSASWPSQFDSRAGIHELALITCSTVSGRPRCSNRAEVVASRSGTLHWLAANQSLVFPSPEYPIARIDESAVVAPRLGTLVYAAADGSTVSAGQVIGYVLFEDDDHVDRIQIVNDPATQATWQTANVGADFAVRRFDLRKFSEVGAPLDAAFDPSGAAWISGEFGYALAQISNNTARSFTQPLRRNQGNSTSWPAVRPFRTKLAKESDGTPVRAHFSELAERVISSRNAVWATYGGGLFISTPGNYSRVMRFALDSSDSPSTPYDDRICAIHVPGDSNQIIGTAYDPARSRVWLVAGKANDISANYSQPALYWFADSGTQQALSDTSPTPPCDNLANYEDASAMSELNRSRLCATDSDVRCVHRVRLPQGIGYPEHVWYDNNGTPNDASDDLLWITSIFADVSGARPWTDRSPSVVARYRISDGSLRCVGLPVPTPTGLRSLAGGFPWQVRADSTYVYVLEYADNDLIRIPKSNLGETTDCSQAPPPSATAEELHLPVLGDEQVTHSFDIARGKAWFTYTIEEWDPRTPDVSGIGYVDLVAWGAGARRGVIYQGLTDGAYSLSGDPHHMFRGIDVDDASGKIIVADASGGAYLLVPR